MSTNGEGSKTHTPRKVSKDYGDKFDNIDWGESERFKHVVTGINTSGLDLKEGQPIYLDPESPGALTGEMKQGHNYIEVA